MYSSFTDPIDNGTDEVAFVARVSSGGTGVWANNKLVAFTGNAAPGCPAGTVFAGFTQIGLPDQGGVVFLATVAGTGVTSANNTGIWAVDTKGNLNLILRIGDIYGGNVVSSLAFLPQETTVGSQTRSFEQNAGDLTAKVTFTNGSVSLVKVVFP
jgi:hypothetical protein